MAVLVALLLVPGAAESARGGEVVTSLNVDQVRSILAGMGFEFTQTDDRTFRFELEGYKVFLFCSATDCQLYAGFKDACTAARINEWNRTKRFSRAYLDREGDPCIEADLDVAAGVTRETIREFIKTFRLSVRAFAQFLRK